MSRHLLEVTSRIIIIPAHYNYIVIRTLLLIIVISGPFLVIIIRALTGIFHLQIERSFNTTISENSRFDSIIVSFLNNYGFFKMLDSLKAVIGHSIAVNIILLINRSLPCSKICDTYGMLSACRKVQIVAVIQCHMLSGITVLSTGISVVSSAPSEANAQQVPNLP